LLNHDAARSQQVRITLNKFRLSQGNDDLSGPGADVTNISLIEQLRWCSRAADQRCSHEGEEDKTRTKFFNHHSVVKNFLTARPIIRFTGARENAAGCNSFHTC